MRFEQRGAGVASAVGWVSCGGTMLGGCASLLCGDVPSLCGMGLVGVVGLVVTVSKIRRLGGAVLAGTGVMMDVCWGRCCHRQISAAPLMVLLLERDGLLMCGQGDPLVALDQCLLISCKPGRFS